VTACFTFVVVLARVLVVPPTHDFRYAVTSRRQIVTSIGVYCRRLITRVISVPITTDGALSLALSVYVDLLPDLAGCSTGLIRG